MSKSKCDTNEVRNMQAKIKLVCNECTGKGKGGTRVTETLRPMEKSMIIRMNEKIMNEKIVLILQIF